MITIVNKINTSTNVHYTKIYYKIAVAEPVLSVVEVLVLSVVEV